MSKDKELKDQRIPIMMSESEVQALDDWSFKNRIRSRGEAIRRLCQMALILDAKLTPLANAFNKFGAEYGELIKALGNVFNEQVNKMETAEKIAMHTTISASKLTELKYTLRELTGRAYEFKRDVTFEEAVISSENNKEIFDEMLLTLAEINKKCDDLKNRVAEADD